MAVRQRGDDAPLGRLALPRLAPHPHRVVPAPRHQPRLAPVQAVDGAAVIPGQRRHALPRGLAAAARALYPLVVAGAVALPDLDAGVLAAAGQPLPGLVPGDVPHGVGVAAEGGHRHPVVPVLAVQLDGVVVAAAGQHGQLGVPGHRLHVLGVGVEHAGAAVLVILRVHVPQPHALVAAAGGEELPARAPHHALHLVLVALEAGAALVLAALLVPDGDGAVEAGGGEVVAAGGPVDAAHGAGVALGEHGAAHPALARPPPQPHRLVLAAGGQQVPAGVPGHVPHAAHVSRQHCQGLRRHSVNVCFLCLVSTQTALDVSGSTSTFAATYFCNVFSGFRDSL